ncbi:MAG: hypothetical protein APR54_04815 [Candidatus Cloacimonas sp. SDB]|nr:MAG: hypothetical protein APR54_04815 [Candidatus Cloacimonas sp. SDB]
MKEIRTAGRLNSISKSAIRKIFDAKPEDAINLGLGEIQIPTPDKIRNYAQKILKTGYISYTSNAGDRELIYKIKQYYEVESEQDVCVTVGAEEALFISILSYVEAGDEVLIPNPGFVAYESIINIAGGSAIKFDLNPENGFRVDLDDLRVKVNSRTKMIVFSNPSNPLGTSLNQQEFDLFLEIARKSDIILLVDEIYRELYHIERPDTFLAKQQNVIVVSGLSKSHCMTGWRIGWAIGAAKLIAPLITLHQYVCTCASYLSQKTAIFALSAEGMKEKEIIRTALCENYKYLEMRFKQELPELELLNPAASPYLFFKIGKEEDRYVEALSKAGIITLPGIIFGSNGKGWIRLSYGLERHILERALDRIVPVIKILHKLNQKISGEGE